MIAYKFTIQQGKATATELVVARSQTEAERRLRACFQYEYGKPTITYVGTEAVKTLLFLAEEPKIKYKKKVTPENRERKRRQKFTF